MPRESERREAERRRDERDRLIAGAAELRRVASEDGHAGIRGRYVADALAAVLDCIALGTDPRTDALTAVRLLVHGPDGPTDHRRDGTASRFHAGPSP